MAKAKTGGLGTIKLQAKSKVTRSLTTGFVLLNPFGAEIYKRKSKFMVYWTGGPGYPGCNVNIYLIDEKNWCACLVIATNLPYNGVFGAKQFQIPANFIPTSTPPHAHEYLVYIEDVPQTTWRYGDIFQIWI